MAKSRLELSSRLRKVLGSNNCYFSPPTGLRMKYPCIVYHLSNIDNIKADNLIYRTMKLWTITVIDENPDSTLPEELMNEFPYCSFDRHYVVDGLNHTVLSLYF